MQNSLKGNNSITPQNIAQHHNSTITRSYNIIKDLDITHNVEKIRATKEALEEEVVEEEALEEDEDQ
jgi:hypothetical protein